jgi:polysaccharide deacetylase family protein (PEP-CTERM system associated)
MADPDSVIVQRQRVPLVAAPLEGRPTAAFTVDVEDWYQSCVDLDAPITERVVRNVDRIVEILDDAGVKGTFFVQGRVAETFPRMLEELVAAGHEIQSHGYSHRSLFSLDRAALRDELERSVKSVEDACGRRVTAFRAPDFSILAGNLWALESLAEAGFVVDSSIFPQARPRYGIRDWDVAPQRLTLASGAHLLEVPVAVWGRRSVRLPVAGGGYFRVLPTGLVSRALRSIINEGRPVVVYCHPYEFAPEELRDYRGRIPARQRMHQGLGRHAIARRTRRLLDVLPFGRFDETLAAWGLT